MCGGGGSRPRPPRPQPEPEPPKLGRIEGKETAARRKARVGISSLLVPVAAAPAVGLSIPGAKN